MGCGGSKNTIIDLHSLAPRPTAHPPAPLNANQLKHCLSQVATYIHQRRRRQLHLVVIGGVVNTILLKTRHATEDVDLLTVNLSRDDATLLTQAARFVREQNPDLHLDENWLNSNAGLFVQPELRSIIIQEGIAQNEIVFNAPGLTLYAAPYSYAIVAKLNRIAGQGARSHDLGDVVAYLRRYLSLRNESHITMRQIESWCREYRSSCSGLILHNVIEAVSQEYLRVFGEQSIVS